MDRDTTLPRHARLTARGDLGVDDVNHLITLTGARAFKRMVCPPDDMVTIHGAVRTLGSISFEELLSRTTTSEAVLESAILWLAKYDLIRLEF